jgi:hypothetical protein
MVAEHTQEIYHREKTRSLLLDAKTEQVTTILKKKQDQEEMMYDRRVRELEEVERNNIQHLIEHETSLKKKKDTQAELKDHYRYEMTLAKIKSKIR